MKHETVLVESVRGDAKKRVYKYGKQDVLPIIGMIPARANIGKLATETTFNIVGDSDGQYEPLLCNSTAKQLGVLMVGEDLV